MLHLLLTVLLAAPQDSRPDSRAEARTLLTAVAAQQKDLRRARARYVQERTTTLRRQPMVTEGTLWFRKDPACIVFLAATPRPARIRLDAGSYEVYREQERQLERFLLGSSDLPNALFQAFSPDLRQLDARFTIESCTPGPETSIRLLPKLEGMRRFLTELTLTISRERLEVTRIAYRDGQGDLVAIRLEDLVRDPESDGDPFDPAVPEGTRVLVHPARLPAGPESRTTAESKEPKR